MTTRELYQQGKYREIVEAVNPDSPGDDNQLLTLGWAFHQLGEYGQSTQIMRGLRAQYGPDTDIGDGARRGLAHGFQQLGQLDEANQVLAEIVPSLARDNVRAVAILQETRNDGVFPMAEAQQMISRAMWTIPRQANNNAHIVNNLTFAMYEGRRQEVIKPYLFMLHGLIEVAVGIYEEVKAQKNHLAECLFRASQIFLDIADWVEEAYVAIQESVRLWEEIVASQGGRRYQTNLENARAQLRRVEEQRGQVP